MPCDATGVFLVNSFTSQEFGVSAVRQRGQQCMRIQTNAVGSTGQTRVAAGGERVASEQARIK
jgi:hypothetical protein